MYFSLVTSFFKNIASIAFLIGVLLSSTIVHAAVLVGVDDNYGIPQNEPLVVEAFGVLENDTLDGENAGESGATAVLISNVSNGTLVCPGVGAGLCADGSFEYTPDTNFSGEDSFVYQAISNTDTSALTTVTLSACSGGPVIFSCWNESAYRNKLTSLGYSTFQESFENDLVWADTRSSINNPGSAPYVVSQGIRWTTNFPETNQLSTGSGAARTGNFGAYDASHGFATGTAIECDVDTPPTNCLFHDGVTGSLMPGVSTLHAVGGYVAGTNGAKPAVILDGTTQVTFGPVFGFQFVGVIDTSVNGFSDFEFREIGGKIGQALYVFFDDFILTTDTPYIGDGDVSPLGSPDGLINAGDYLIMNRFTLGDISPSALELSHGDIYPSNMPDGIINIQDLILHEQLLQ